MREYAQKPNVGENEPLATHWTLRYSSSGCLARAYVMEKLLLNNFSVTISSRFEIVGEEYIVEVKDKMENENTKRSMEYWENVFKR